MAELRRKRQFPISIVKLNFSEQELGTTTYDCQGADCKARIVALGLIGGMKGFRSEFGVLCL
jgi:hypothetical protein